ncbi:hypothetical protein [Algicola sagamiensis]|uniref:hypothetical protein n=1 Tax=Algicola sagamiensis TaxID=163869 RepID=UPI000368B249|nr:hypothetical protein [Algicola sagamiensis]
MKTKKYKLSIGLAILPIVLITSIGSIKNTISSGKPKLEVRKHHVHIQESFSIQPFGNEFEHNPLIAFIFGKTIIDTNNVEYFIHDSEFYVGQTVEIVLQGNEVKKMCNIKTGRCCSVSYAIDLYGGTPLDRAPYI